MHGSTLGRAYTELIDSFSESAQDHVNLADGLDAQVVNVLKMVEKRHEEVKKKVVVHGTAAFRPSHVGCPSQQVKAFQKLLSDRDRAYGDRTKVRGACVIGPSVLYPNFVSSEQTNGILTVCWRQTRVADGEGLVRRRMCGSRGIQTETGGSRT